MANTPGQSGYAPVNGLKMYYEIHGTGQPLILMHGGVGAIEKCGEVLPLLYASVALNPEDLPVLVTKLGQLLGEDYDWSEDMATIEAPTMIVFGDADSVRTAHAVRFFTLLGGQSDAGWIRNARLAILPGTTHYDIFSSPSLASAVAPFLDAPMPETD